MANFVIKSRQNESKFVKVRQAILVDLEKSKSITLQLSLSDASIDNILSALQKGA